MSSAEPAARRRPTNSKPSALTGAVRIKRAYETPEPSDGHRVLVDRLWPRGLRKSQVPLDGWIKDIAVSDELRRWFGHDPTRWNEFVTRYRRELRSPAAQRVIDELVERARSGPVTLVYSAHDEQHNNAVVLRQAIEETLAAVPARAARPKRKRGGHMAA